MDEARLGLGVFLVALALSVALGYPIRGEAQAPPTVRFIGFSPQLSPGDKLECRQAVAYAIDRDAIAKAVAPHLPNARPASNFQHPALRGYDPNTPGFSYDPGKAKALFTQCGFAGAFRILVGPSTARSIEVYNEAVADSLRRTLGVQVEWNRVANFNVLVQAARAGNAPIWMFAWGAVPSDPGYPSIAMGLVSELISDPEVKALAQKGDARAVEEAILGKALIIPTIYY